MTLQSPDDVPNFWFPDTGHEASPETHAAFWDERMQGGMDARIISDANEFYSAVWADILKEE